MTIDPIICDRDDCTTSAPEPRGFDIFRAGTTTERHNLLRDAGWWIDTTVGAVRCPQHHPARIAAQKATVDALNAALAD